MIDDGRLIKKIMLKEGRSVNSVTTISNMFESWGKFLENGRDENGRYYIVALFDDDMDFLAFQVYIGWAK